MSAPPLVAAWVALMAAAVAWPPLAGSDRLAEDWTRLTVRVALAFYTAAAFVLLRLPAREWAGPRGRAARLCWTLAWAAYVVHLGFAAEYHQWSHAAAVAHTDRRTGGYGAGIYVSHLFTLLWTLDVAWWWAAPASHAARPWRLGAAWHAFAAFLWFNGAVVYETGFIRAAGLAAFALLAARGGGLAPRPASPEGEP